jgi:glutamate racemase
VDSGEAIARRAAWLFEQQGLEVKSLMALNSDGDVVDAALFSGDIPRGIGEFLDGLGLATNDIRGNWSSSVVGAIASGSA